VVESVRDALLKTGRGGGVDIVFSSDETIVYRIVDVFDHRSGIGAAVPGANIRSLDQDRQELVLSLPLGAVDIDLDQSSLADVDYLKSRGLLLLANLGDTPPLWRSMIEWHVDGFKTNYPEEYTEWWFST